MPTTTIALDRPGARIVVRDVYEKLAREFDEPYLDNPTTDDSEVTFADKVMDALNEVVNDIASRYDWRWTRAEDTISTIPGETQYPLPADCAHIVGDITIDNVGIVKRKSLQYLNKKASLGTNTIDTYAPRIYAVDSDGSLVIWPTPGDAWVMVLEYQREIEPFTSLDDIVPVPLIDRQLVYNGCRALLKASDGNDPQTVLRADKAYEQGILRSMLREIDAEDDSTPSEEQDQVDDL